MGDKDSAEGAVPTSSRSEELLGAGDIVLDDGGSRTREADGTTERSHINAEADSGICPEEPDADGQPLARAHSLSVDAIHKHYCKDLLESANTLQSICNVQDTSISLIESKEKVLYGLRESYQLEEILDEAQRYFEKLVGLKRDMAALSKKSKDLTRRAAYVKSVREKEKAKKDQERKRLERLEQDLAPRYSSDLA